VAGQGATTAGGAVANEVPKAAARWAIEVAPAYMRGSADEEGPLWGTEVDTGVEGAATTGRGTDTGTAGTFGTACEGVTAVEMQEEEVAAGVGAAAG